MARPHKQTVDYFPHNSNASSGKTIYILESKFGNDGYAFWFKLLEILANSEGHFYDARNPVAWEFLLAKTHVTEEIGNQIMNLLISLDAIDSDLWGKNIIWSQNLVDNITDVYRNRTTGIPTKPSLNGSSPLSTSDSAVIVDENLVSDVENLVSDVDNPQTKLYYTKVNNKDIYTLPEFIDKELWDDFLIMRGKIKKPPTNRAIKELIADLVKINTSGEDANESLRESIKNNWRGIFPPKEKTSGINKGSTRDNKKDPKRFTSGTYGSHVKS